MKKKVIFGISGVLIVAVIAAMLIFVLNGKNNMSTETVKMNGTWKVVVYVKDGSATLVDNEFMVFDVDNVSDYRDDFSKPYAKSKYEIDKELKMKLPDISRNYTVKKYTSNYVRLFEDQNTYIDLIKYPNSDFSKAEFDKSKLMGRWNVIYRNTDQIISDEYLIFEADIMSDYRNGNEDPAVTSEYKWNENNHLVADKLGMDMIANVVSDNTVIFIESDTGYIWELQKAE